MATVEQLRDVQTAAPFRPYEIRLADGRSYTVPHPEYLSIDPRPRARSAVYYEPKGKRTHMLDIGLIAEIVTDTPDAGEEAPTAGAEPAR